MMSTNKKSQKRMRRKMNMSFRKRALFVLKRGKNLTTPDGRTVLRQHRLTPSLQLIRQPISSKLLSHSSNPKTKRLSNLLRLKTNLAAISQTC